MELCVLKFGGSSVATAARIKRVAEIIAKLKKEGQQVVVVTSAMQGVTNNLVEMTRFFSESSFNREYDAIVSTGEQIAAGMLAMALQSIGISAKSFAAWQIPIEVSGPYSDAKIVKVDAEKIRETVSHGIVPVITGFQGISKNGDVCTIGRGGSDATACAIAKWINADECLIYTDVDGVYTADPRIALDARKIEEISYDDMVELASWGAKVLQKKSTLIAKEYNVKLKVLSSFSGNSGTVVSDQTKCVFPHIVGIAHNLDLFALYTQSSDEDAHSKETPCDKSHLKERRSEKQSFERTICNDSTRNDFPQEELGSAKTYSGQFFHENVSLGERSREQKHICESIAQMKQSQPPEFAELFGQFHTMIRQYPGFCLIPRSIQSDVQALLENAGINAKIDNDIGAATIVWSSSDISDGRALPMETFAANKADDTHRDFSNFEGRSECHSENNGGSRDNSENEPNGGFPEGQSQSNDRMRGIERATILKTIYKVICDANFEIKEKIECEKTTTLIVPFQQTVSVVNKLHEIFSDILHDTF